MMSNDESGLDSAQSADSSQKMSQKLFEQDCQNLN